ncbi:hypothetical protein E4U19_007631 [Claviceps sp. Clav32 group G5]|nr:hypothetical protein E4U19_007631 [Claviceps sp. Clav32 group G5]KAG6040440.1 hypothetical protein E4U39_007133 [Claviceps sp. Clav50 group G5]
MKFYSLITTALAASQTAFAAIGNSWKFTGNPKGGLRDITFPFRMEGAAHKSGYFFAQQFKFQGINSISFCGFKTQPNGPGGRSVLRAVFTTFQAGATTEDSHCRGDADGGPGVSCSIDFYGDYFAIFNIMIENVGGTTWKATAINTSTGVEIHIGTWTLPSVAGGIVNNQVGFIEYSPWNSGRHHCANLPRTTVSMFNPFSRTIGSGNGTILAPYQYGDCIGKIAFLSQRVPNGYHIQCGFYSAPSRRSEGLMLSDAAEEETV